LRHDHSLLLVIWGWDSLEDLQSVQGGGASGSLVGDHASDGLVEDTGRSSEVEGTTAGWVESGDLAEIGMVLDYSFVSVEIRKSQWWSLRRTLSTEEFARDVESLRADNNDLLAVQQLLCDGTGETTEQVALAIDNNLDTHSHQYHVRMSQPRSVLWAPQILRLGQAALTTGSNVDILPSLQSCRCEELFAVWRGRDVVVGRMSGFRSQFIAKRKCEPSCVPRASLSDSWHTHVIGVENFADPSDLQLFSKKLADHQSPYMDQIAYKMQRFLQSTMVAL